MKDRAENDASDPDLIRAGLQLQQSLHGLLLNSVCERAPDLAQWLAASMSAAQWNINKPPRSPVALPEFLSPQLSHALGAASQTPENVQEILDALDTLLPHVTWVNRQAGPGQDEAFVERHRHGMITGPEGLFECPSLTLGLALMAPRTTYPFHKHPPAEFYLVLSPGQWYREDAGWWSPGAGGLVFNPPSCIHAMKSTDVPLLALWGLMH